MFTAIGLDFYVGIVTAIWFAIVGIQKTRPRPSSGRRTVPTPKWQSVARIARGMLEFISALAIVGLAVLSVIMLNVPPLGVYVGLLLALLSLWNVADAILPDLRPIPLVVALVGFVLAVFYAGFRSDLGAFTMLAAF